MIVDTPNKAKLDKSIHGDSMPTPKKVQLPKVSMRTYAQLNLAKALLIVDDEDNVPWEEALYRMALKAQGKSYIKKDTSKGEH